MHRSNEELTVTLTIYQVQAIRRAFSGFPMNSLEYSIFNMLTNRMLDGY